MVFFDPPRMIIFRDHLRLTAHFGAHSLDELFDFMDSLKIPRRAFHDKINRPHYDLFDESIQRAIHAGAVLISSKEFILIMRSHYGE